MRTLVPKASPSSNVCGKLTPNVSGKQIDNIEPAMVSSPMINIGNKREYSALKKKKKKKKKHLVLVGAVDAVIIIIIKSPVVFYH